MVFHHEETNARKKATVELWHRTDRIECLELLIIVTTENNFSEFSFFFFVKICPDDDCRTSVETLGISKYLLIGDNYLLCETY